MLWSDRVTSSGSPRAPRATRVRGTTWQRLTAAALAFPGVSAGTSYSTPALHARKKLLARLREDGESVAVRVDLLERDVLLQADPRALFLTDHYVNHPWILLRLKAVRHSDAVALIERALDLVTPKRRVALKQSRRSKSPSPRP